MGVYQIQNTSYHVNNLLLTHWEKNSLKKMKKLNSDRVYVVDGRERSGKSWFTMQQAAVIDPSMFKDIKTFLSRICFTPEEFFKAVRHVKNGVIIFDEAFRGFSSRASLSKTNKKLVQALMEMGQNNNIVFIVLPSFFLLDMYPAMLRSDGLFNIYLDKKSGKRVWKGFNRRDKNQIWQMGVKKGWTYRKSSYFKGNFYNKFPCGKKYEEAYTKKKREALHDMDSEAEKESRVREERDILIYRIKEDKKLSESKMAAFLNEWGIQLSAAQVGNINRKQRDMPNPQHIVI